MANDRATKRRQRPVKAGSQHSSPKKRPKIDDGSNKRAATAANKQERQSQRRHADVVVEAKRLWNQLRLKSNTPEQSRKLMDQLLPIVKDKAKEIAFQHDAARVVQAVLQFGTPAERTAVLRELQDGLVELAKSQYGHFCVIKAIKYCHNDMECVKILQRTLAPEMPKLAVHAVGSRVVECLFATLPTKALPPFKLPLYGPHANLFAVGNVEDTKVPTLVSVLQKDAIKKEPTLEFVRSILSKGMEKNLYGYAYFQQFTAEYCEVADGNAIRVLASSNAADNAIHLISTRSGTRVLCDLIAYGAAKDRKRVLKSLKGFTMSGLLHRDAYLALIRLVQLTDDTVAIHKNMLNEILTSPSGKGDDTASSQPLVELAISDKGSKLLLFLLSPTAEARDKYFDPYELSVLFSHPCVIENGEEVPTSKKDDAVRRKELLKDLIASLWRMCCEHTRALLTSVSGAAVLREVYAIDASPELVDAVASCCVRSLGRSESGSEDRVDGENNESMSLFEDKQGHLSIKNLLSTDVQQRNGLLAIALCDKVGDRIMDVAASNRGAFVVEILLKNKSTRKSLLANLDCKIIQQRAEATSPNAGFEALAKAMLNNR